MGNQPHDGRGEAATNTPTTTRIPTAAPTRRAASKLVGPIRIHRFPWRMERGSSLDRVCPGFAPLPDGARLESGDFELDGSRAEFVCL
jgi:hypothetical protein